MYYVNREQLEERLRFLPTLADAARSLAAIRRDEETAGSMSADALLAALAAERVVHLAIEAVTDIGSLLIDGFLMRDASSYEDIVEIIRGEQVVDAPLAAALIELTMERRPLVQQYYALERGEPHPLVDTLPQTLTLFGEAVRAFVERELL